MAARSGEHPDPTRRHVVVGLAALAAGFATAGCAGSDARSPGASGPGPGGLDDPPPSTGSEPPGDPIRVPAGLVVLVADRSNCAIRSIVDGRVTTLAGGEPGDADGTAIEASFLLPFALAARSDGTVAVADHGNCRLRTLHPDGRVETLAGSEPGLADGMAADARFDGPFGMAESPDGTLYVADTFNHRIRALAPDGTVSTVAGGEAGLVDGPAADARFDEPTGVVVARDGTLLVADRANHRIRAIAPDGTVSTFAGSTVGPADGPATDAQFNRPTALALTPDGALVVADCIGHRIRLVAPDGTVSTLAGDGTKGFADGPGATASFAEPCGVSVASSGHVVVADRQNHRVRIIDPSGTVGTLAGGSRGSADGPARQAAFDLPFGVLVTEG